MIRLNFHCRRLKHVLRAKAVLCPGLLVRLHDEASGEKLEWRYEDGVRDYLIGELGDAQRLPEDPFIGNMTRQPGSRRVGAGLVA